MRSSEHETESEQQQWPTVQEFLVIEDAERRQRSRRRLQRQRPRQAGIPMYTSPPTPYAVECTPESYQSDEVINSFRTKAAMGGCSADGDETTYCQIPFEPPSNLFEISKVGVIMYIGAFVDPRGYAPLAKTMAQRYGIPTVIPIFDSDVPLRPGSCDTGRLPMAMARFEDVEKWVLVGHSFGGIAASVDVWSAMTSVNSTIDFDSIGGLTMFASDILDIGCGNTTFADTEFPMALSSATEDEILNQTRYKENLSRVSNATFYVEILGGNHGQYGSYDDSGRVDALGPSQMDGVAIIPSEVQWDISTSAIFHVASRSGVPLPQKIPVSPLPTVSPSRFPTRSSEVPSNMPAAFGASNTPTAMPAGMPSMTPMPSPTRSSNLPSPNSGTTTPPTSFGPTSSIGSIRPHHSIFPWIAPLALFLVYWR